MKIIICVGINFGKTCKFIFRLKYYNIFIVNICYCTWETINVRLLLQKLSFLDYVLTPAAVSIFLHKSVKLYIIWRLEYFNLQCTTTTSFLSRLIMAFCHIFYRSSQIYTIWITIIRFSSSELWLSKPSSL